MDTPQMYYIEKTAVFDKWFRRLRDLKAKAKILFRIQRLERDGHFGDYKVVGHGVKELRIHFAKGYRIYVAEKNNRIILLLMGGEKSTQQKDIEKAKKIWKTLNA